jgi:hypothetical protein
MSRWLQSPGHNQTSPKRAGKVQVARDIFMHLQLL